MEVRTWDGTAEELSAFVIAVWRESYAGRMAFPLWTADYLEWQLNFSSVEARESQLAAWCDGQLAGVLLGWNYVCRRGDRRDPAVLSSWLSVRPEFRGRGVVKAFKAEQDARMARKGHGLVFAYRYFGSEHSLSKGPTPEQLASGQWDSRRVGFWVRILSPKRASKWYLQPSQRWITLLGAPFTLNPRAAKEGSGIRPWRPEDASACVSLLRARKLECTIDWDEESLARHCSGFGRCLVMEVDGVIRGMVTWHVLTFVGAVEEPVGILDIVATEGLPKSSRRAILNAALAEMKRDGAVLALKLRTGDSSTLNMVQAGFIPWFTDSYETLHSVGSPLTPVLDRPHHVLWR
ncbi:MAG TPA: hypothetical protein VM452_10245 [Caulifigura sp.]|jgi:GNAT superfamily N-acetyltransferase|nr:hypothetical protein [Caulifigura sp.]